MRLLLSLFSSVLVLTLLTGAAAQQQLVVNGTFLDVRTELVPGSAYAPAEAYARALGAEYRFDARTGVLISFGGRFLSLQSFPAPAQAAAATSALMIDGRRLPSTGAVSVDETVYLPVKTVTAALGGRTAYLTETKTVAVVFPRPKLTAVSPPGAWGSYERFVLTFDAPVAVENYFEPSLGVVRFRFPRAELGAARLSGRPFKLSGGRISDAAFVSSGGFLDFNLTLQKGNSYRTFSEPHGAGERIVIDVFRDAADSTAGAQTPVLVLAAEPGTLELAQRLKAALESRGVQAQVQRAAPPETAQLGFAAPFLLTLRQAPLPVGQFNIYYLPGDAPALSAPIRRAPVEAALSDDARAQLARLAPDAALGERMAQGLATGLSARTSLTLGTLMTAPLETLGGAAGRGVMLELGTGDLNRPNLAATLASLLNTLLQGS